MATVFSNHFSRDPAATLSYRDLGGHVKAAHFVFANVSNNVIGTADRVWLTILPPNAKIIGGFLMVTESFGSGINGMLRRETGDTALFSPGVTFSLSNTTTPLLLDRSVRAVGAVMPAKPVNIKGERIGLSLSGPSDPGAGKLHGVILYV